MKTTRPIAARTLLLLLVAVAMTGCYRKVIRASGPGASRYDVEEPTKPWLSDLFGDSDSKKSSK
jgi:hypothetical protein